MSLEKFLTNMQYISNRFEDNDDILTEDHNILLLFHKVHIPILTHFKNALQLSYDLDLDKSVVFDFISNIISDKSSNLP